jgi:4-hydroxybenzoate polyprenyltransferase
MTAFARTYVAIQTRWAAAGAAGTLLVHLRLLRPTTRLWLDTITPIAALMALTGGAPRLATVVLFILAMNLIHAAAHIFNDLEDAETDRRSSELLRASRPLAQESLSRRTAATEGWCLAALGVGLAFAMTPLFGLFILLLTGMTLMNELPPVRVQSRTYLAQVYTTLGLTGLMLAAAYVVKDAQLARATPFLLFIVIYLGLAETLVKDVRDVDNDAVGGKLTTAVKYGASRAAGWAVSAYALAAFSWFWFCFSYGHLRVLPLSVATVVLAGWIAYTAVASRQLQRTFSKSTCVRLHQGSVLVFTCLNIAAILAIAV